MGRRIIECAANFSEGRDPAIIGAICEVIAQGAGVAVIHQTSDPDHNRSVITFAGAPGGVASAAVRAVAAAAELIDLTKHTGVHPRLGAADVIPFIPIDGVTLEECAALAHNTGDEIWRSTGVPVYFYEAAARRPERERLENVRRGGFEILRSSVLTDETKTPDVGGPDLHPTAGAVIVGARKILIAWNVNLTTPDLAAAKTIARKIRASSGGLRCVKALGLMLKQRNQAQISMNLTDYEITPLHVVFEAIRREAVILGVEIAGTEIIGLIPSAALEAAAGYWLHAENLTAANVLDRRIREALP